jgi:hypothetical protein
MAMNSRRSSWLFAPVHAAALLSAAKSFRDNPILGNAALNEAGLHVWRVRLAAAMAAARRRRLAYLLKEKDVGDFDRDGFVLKQNYLPAASFRALRDEVAALAAPAREMIQGDVVTRRIALDADTLARLPAARALVEDPYWLALIRYAASSALTPLTYVQTIFSRVRPGALDPRTLLHADTFHSTVKAWFSSPMSRPTRVRLSMFRVRIA